jgi:hypothetical protein
VYDFSAMTEREVHRLIAASRGQRLCGRLYRRSDGTILTRDCPVGLRARIRRLSRAAGAALSAVMSVGFAAAQTSPQSASSPLVQIQQVGSVEVVVRDQGDDVVPGAQIVVVSRDGKSKAEGTTNAGGRFVASGLAAGLYDVTVKAPGFGTRQDSIRISSTKALTISLQVSLQGPGMMMGWVVEPSHFEFNSIQSILDPEAPTPPAVTAAPTKLPSLSRPTSRPASSVK